MPTQTDEFSTFMQSISPGYKSPVKKEFTKEELEQLNKEQKQIIKPYRLISIGFYFLNKKILHSFVKYFYF